MQYNLEKLIPCLNPSFLKQNEPLALHTVVKIGGPAELWYEPDTTEEFINAIKKAREFNIPVTILGRGSNTLISDNGIKGLVIRNASRKITVGEENRLIEATKIENKSEIRWENATEEIGGKTMYEFLDLDYTEIAPKVSVTIESGVDMPFAINYLLNLGITGLQWYSRIPGNLGGWIYNNTHGGTHLLEEVVENVTVLNEKNEIKILPKSELEFGYDYSRFHKTKEIILCAELSLYKGDKERAKAVAIEWAKRKAIQPPISTGCVFKNITEEQKAMLNYPTNSVGYIVEKVLKLSGFGVGDAVISSQHHNFVENKGNATASQYLEVLKKIKLEAESKLNLKLIPEISFIGFTNEELRPILY